MYLSRLHLAVFTAIIVSHTVADAQPRALREVTSKVLPIVTSAALLFMPLSLDAVPNTSAPTLRPYPAQQKTWSEEYVGRSVFFTRDGVGQRGIVTANDGYSAHILLPTGLATQEGGGYEEVTVALERIEGLVDWEQRNRYFVTFTTRWATNCLELENCYSRSGDA